MSKQKLIEAVDLIFFLPIYLYYRCQTIRYPTWSMSVQYAILSKCHKISRHKQHATILPENTSGSLIMNAMGWVWWCEGFWCFICKVILSLMERHTEENIWKRWLYKQELEVGYCLSSRKVKGWISPPDLSFFCLSAIKGRMN